MVKLRRIATASLVLGLVPLLALAAEVPLVKRDGRAYVPLASVATALTATVGPVDDAGKVRVTVARQTLVLARGSAEVRLDGTPITLSSPVVVSGRRWLVPLDFLARVVPRVAAGARIIAVPEDGGARSPDHATKPGPGKPPVARPDSRVGGEPRPAARAELAAGSQANGASPAPLAKLLALRARSYLTHTRVVVEADAPFGFRMEPDRAGIRVSLEGLAVSQPRSTQLDDGFVREVRLTAEPGRPTLTVSLLQPAGDVRPVTLSSPFRLVLDLPRPATPVPAALLPGPARPTDPPGARAAAPAPPLVTAAPPAPPAPPEAAPAPPAPTAAGGPAPPPTAVRPAAMASAARSEAERGGSLRRPAPRGSADGSPALRHIVIDAGHGGHDSGALGPTGLMEKDIVLDIARRVARLVHERLRIRVSLTREDDTFIALRDRASFANRERADLFVSIHANAHRDVASEGVETYFLSLEATDNAASQVAERENEVVKLETVTASDRSEALRAMLWDLSQNAFIEESSNLAEVVQDSMSDSLGIPNRGVKQAGFYVLAGAAMPAVLVEIGFVTNRREERRLRLARYREDIARAILAGIEAYKQRYDQRMRAGVEPAR